MEEMVAGGQRTADEQRAERLPKAFYVFYYGAAACLIPFLSLYYDQIGLSGDQIGLLAGIPSVLVLVGGALWGSIADATGRHRLALILAIMGSIVCTQVLSGIESFLFLVPVVLVLGFFMSPIVPLVDHGVLELLGERRERYGKVRRWGAVGWGLVGPLIGWIVEHFGIVWSFRGYAVLMFLCLLVVRRLPVQTAAVAGPLGGGLKRLLADRRWRLFLFLAFLAGMSSGFAFHYLFLYMDSLGATRSTMGWTLSVATASELVAFSFADRWLRRWGARPLLIVGLLASVLRLFAYSIATQPWQVLVVQLLHGPSFAVMWMAGVSWANRIAPAGMGATAQGLFGGINFGLGGMAAALVGGALLERVGATAMYSWATLGMLVGVALYFLAERLFGDENDSA
ncbi:MAG: PPP family 3-phenylpropionic acid transporter [Candidatus Latescibacterota bacterium]